MDIKELYIFCDKETLYDQSAPITSRLYFNEGSGQLCEDCYYRLCLEMKGCGGNANRDITDDEEIEKTKAMLHLMHELNEGRRSGEEEGWVSEETVRARFLNVSK